MSEKFPCKADRVQILNQDCNSALSCICDKIDWHRTRAVLFLDPYAADVTWDTLKIVAETQAIDVWYLFPFSAANRMMKKNGEIDPSWRDKLNSIFGDSSWESRFYQDDPQLNLWGTTTKIRDTNTQALKGYIEERLATLFPKVSNDSRILFNSKNSPLFLFCFAVSSKNPKAIGLATKVANYILKGKNLN